MSVSQSRTRMPRSTLLTGAIALLALAACLLLGLHSAQQALLSYLFAYLFFLAPALGSVALLMVHALTGGGWGLALRPALLAATRVLPLLAVLLLPVLFGLHALYPWADAGALASDAQLARQRWYLDDTFFVCRAVACFALWLWLAHGLRRRLRTAAPSLARFSAAGLIVYALTITIAAVDWVMSLVPAWRSSVFGLLVGTSQLLGAAAFAVTFTLARGMPTDIPAPRCMDVREVPDACGQRTYGRPGDLGNLLLMLVLAWSYLAFMDYLTAWIADLPAETVWYLPRLETSWRWLGAWLALFALALPFAGLLSRRVKRGRRSLGAVAALAWLAQCAYLFWLVVPSFRPHGFALAWTDPLALIGIGGLCWPGFSHALRGTTGARA